MLSLHFSPVAASLFSTLAILSLILTFVMLGSRWLKNYLYAFTLQSWLIALLSAAVGHYADVPELYLIALFTVFFRGMVLPYLLWRIIRRYHVDREIHEIIRPSSALVIGAALVIFALVISRHIGVSLGTSTNNVVILALTVMLSIKLIGFLMLSIRHEAISQILGLLILENGIFLGSQILVPEMPLLLELVTVFDLLVAVSCFGVLVNYLMADIGTTSSLRLKRLRG